ncbi:Spx/MgsR family RNA polymerase-binding regulatory protein [Spirabiliibacterium falconis]|uniref:Spx/MgsR family RNA polymerase-binding regulatory protein n=1 Tax=Spirabiliibacterium falconis TaxID=572023 RepID=UPI001AAC5461|nr:Spx/MgsR family RNA polymerase-binding regulatory protein [Spirabiliibacterium falconis]MBE2893977.1 Spx/MgsR family RNA polymerase-binding regulatory protein [Spirabiliibacterium falconis]
MLTVYGIKNCDTVKKTLQWLADNGIEATLYDYRQDGIDSALIEKLTALFPWEELVNKRSTTWRNLDETNKTALCEHNISDVLLANPTLIKRPIVLGGSQPLIGFNAQTYASVLKGE